jgi:cell wall-associated NlpC family hydrolase
MSKVRVLMGAIAVAFFLAAFQLQAPPPAAAAAAPTESGAVLSFARNQIGKPFLMGATGLRRYDCSGLVYRTFYEAGLLDRIGGSRKLARGYYRWFKDRGLASKTNPRPGDLVAYAHTGKPVSHIGIFVGWNAKGQPMAISALINPWGVSRHRVFGISVPLKAYLHVNLQR